MCAVNPLWLRAPLYSNAWVVICRHTALLIVLGSLRLAYGMTVLAMQVKQHAQDARRKWVEHQQQQQQHATPPVLQAAACPPTQDDAQTHMHVHDHDDVVVLDDGRGDDDMETAPQGPNSNTQHNRTAQHHPKRGSKKDTAAELEAVAARELLQLRLACLHPQLTSYWRSMSADMGGAGAGTGGGGHGNVALSMVQVCPVRVLVCLCA